MTTPLDESPFDHIAPEQIEILLNVDNVTARDLMANRFLRPLVEDRLRACLSPLPEEQQAELCELFKFICICSTEERHALSRYLCVLMNHQAVRHTTDGRLLRGLADWCSEGTVLYLKGDRAFPALTSLGILSSITRENMELYAIKVAAWLISSLPQAYRERLNLRFPPDQLPSCLPFPGDEHDREMFVRLAVTAYSLMEQGRKRCDQ